MKWIVALLLLANVALYLWIGERADDGEQVPFAQSEVNREGMLLLGEVQASRSAEPAVSAEKPANAAASPNIEPPPDTASPADIQPAQSSQPATEPPAATPSVSCYRIGPFKNEANWSAATRWMKSQSFAYQAVRSESREMRAVRVYLGPFDSPDAAKPVINSLDERGIEHYTDPETASDAAPESQGKIQISLGYFTQEALAVKFVAHLLSQGIEANSRPEYRAMGPFDWMEASIKTTQRDRLRAHHWPKNGVAVLEIDCFEAALH